MVTQTVMKQNVWECLLHNNTEQREGCGEGQGQETSSAACMLYEWLLSVFSPVVIGRRHKKTTIKLCSYLPALIKLTEELRIIIQTVS